MEYCYIFCLRRILDKNNILKNDLQIDGFIEFPNNNVLEHCKLKDDTSILIETNSYLKCMSLRMTFNNDILPFLMKVTTIDFELTREILQMHIDILSKDPDKINSFIAESKI